MASNRRPTTSTSREETCVESRFKDFLAVDGASQRVLDTLETHDSCYFPVLSAFTSTPSLVKSCVDPDYDAPVPSDCYDCISGCLGDVSEGVLRLDCGDAAYVESEPLRPVEETLASGNRGRAVAPPDAGVSLKPFALAAGILIGVL